jgi:large subunit ribosomal protein L25
VSAPSVLNANRRTEIGKSVAHLRKAGRVPAVVFGHGLDSIPVSLDTHEFEHLHRTAHSNAIIELQIDGKDKHRVLIHSIQIDPRHRHLLHVDLLELKKGEEVTVDVPLHSTGDSYAVTRLGGTLLHNIDHIRVRAQPESLPDAITFSVESLDDFEKAIHLRDLPLPTGVTLLSDADAVVAKVAPPHVAEVVEPVEVAVEDVPAVEAKPEA